MSTEKYSLKKNIVFKALTRPAMLLNVPVIPIMIAFCFCFLLAIWIHFLLIALIVPVYFILRLITKIDENIFQIIGIKRFLFQARMKAIKYKKFYGGNYYFAGDFSKDFYKSRSKLNDKGKITMLNLDDALTLEKVIPFSSQITDSVIINRDGFLMSTWEIEGVSYETRDDENIDRYRDGINNIIRSLTQYPVSIYTHTVRGFNAVDNDAIFDNEQAQAVNDAYMQSFNGFSSMKNSIFVTLVYAPISGFEKIKKKGLSVDEKESLIEKNLTEFNEVVNRLSANLDKYGCNLLSCYEINGVKYSKQLEFFNYLLSGEWQKVRVLNKPIYKYLGSKDVFFGDDVGVINNNGKKTFVRSLEIKDWVDDTQSGFLDELLSLNCRFTFTQSFSVLSKAESKKLIKRQSKQLESTEDDSVSQVKDLKQSVDDLVSGKLAFGEHHATFIIYADSLEEVTDSTNKVLARLEDLGFLMTVGNIALDEGYYAQLPSNFKFRPRVVLLSSKNYADLNSLHNSPFGKKTGNCWGDAVSPFKTRSNQPFFFNFHQTRLGRDDFGDTHLGHTLVLGKSGTGKTVLLSFLLNQLMKFKVDSSFPENKISKKFTAIFLDKDRGAEINIRALGGNYKVLKSGQPTGFNPFMMDANETNIEFLKELIKLLVTQGGETLKSAEIEAIDDAVKTVMSFAKEERYNGISRVLENIQDDNTDDNSIKRRLRLWSKDNDGAMWWVFDNDNDELNFDGFLYGFDGTEILDNKSVIHPVALYLLHRIKLIADGRRLPIFIDELWKWLGNECFLGFMYDGLKTFRKLDAFLVGSTQSPDEIVNSPIARALIEQIETFCFLPNSKAEKSDYVDYLKVSHKDFKLIKEFEDDGREFLIKKGNESEGDNRGNTVIAKLDLSSIGKGNLNILSAKADNIKLLNSIVEEVGDDPKDWIPIFKEKSVLEQKLAN
ncbi:VirB4 family type IV secretion/conjugal transfer ATPase [Providencia alcalifaciens]|uniref:VirB4 family type IV secretion/conjugal transfer ATPase n=1 Tax=Providencia alcalifaciens TaxID=126385 RepID=UPI0032DA1C15